MQIVNCLALPDAPSLRRPSRVIFDCRFAEICNLHFSICNLQFQNISDRTLQQLAIKLDDASTTFRRIAWFPIYSASIRVFRKQAIASRGVQTIGSFSLNEVFNTTGTPVSL